MAKNIARDILHSKWFPLVEVGTSIMVVLLAVVMLFGRAPSYEDVPKTYTALVDDLRMRSTDKNRYTLYADHAAKEGNVSLQKLFLALSDSQGLMIEKEYAMVNGLMERSMPSADSAESWGTAENLNAALAQEKYKADSVYPRFSQLAKEESYKEAKGLFDNSKSVAANNHELLSKAKEGNVYERIFVCQECGGLFAEAQDKCIICKSKELKEY